MKGTRDLFDVNKLKDHIKWTKDVVKFTFKGGAIISIFYNNCNNSLTIVKKGLNCIGLLGPITFMKKFSYTILNKRDMKINNSHIFKRP